MFAAFATIVATVLKEVGLPCFKSNVIVPVESGCHVMLKGLPAVKPPDRALAVKVKGLAWAETNAASAARTIEVENCIVIALYSFKGRKTNV